VLKAGEPFGFDVRLDVVDACFESEYIFDKEHNPDKTPLEESRYVFMHEESPSLGFHDIALPNSLDHSHVSPKYSQPSISLQYSLDAPVDNPMICYANNDLGYEDTIFSMLGENVDDYVSLGYFRGYDPSVDPYYVYLEDLPSKII